MALIVAGINYKSAPINIREKLNFKENEIKSLLSQFKADPYYKESLVLSTCNRTEFYFVCNDYKNFLTKFYEFIKTISDLDKEKLERFIYVYSEEKVVDHLFRVASGLESMMIGENQILSQIKTAYSLSCSKQTNGPIINKLFHYSFRTGKRVRNETDIGKGAVSISSAATELAFKFFSDIKDRAILLIGSGDTGRLVASNLMSRGIRNLHIINRTYEKAVELAESHAAKAERWEELLDLLSTVDIVISCTSAKAHIVSKQDIKTVIKKRKCNPLFIIDIAVPRDFDPEISSLKNVFLYSIDDLNVIAEQNMKKRKKEIPKVENIILYETKKFMKWYSTNKTSPLIIDLQKKIEEIRINELERNIKNFREEDWENLNILTKSIIKKIIKLPLLKIKEYTEDTQYGKLRLETIIDIFQLSKSSLEELIPNEKN